MSTKFLFLLLFISALTLSSQALASAVQEAQDLVDEAEYSQASKVIRQALASGRLNKAELIQMYQVQGTVFVALGKQSRAEAAFRNLILADPSFRLASGVSPKVRAVFEEVQRNLLESGALDQAYKPSLEPIATVVPSKDVALRLRVGARAQDIKRVQFFYRRVGTSHYASIDATATADGSWEGAIPGFFLDAERQDYLVEYYAEASDEAQQRLTGVGLPTLPLSFEVLGNEAELGNERDPGPSSGLPLATIGIAVGAVAVVGILAGVGLYFLLNQQGEGSAQVHVVKAN